MGGDTGAGTIDLLPKVWICVVSGASCPFFAVVSVVNVFFGQWLSLAWAALAVCGAVSFTRWALRLHRRNRQQRTAVVL